MCCALLCTVVSVKAASGSLSYSTSSNTYLGELANTSASAKTIAVNEIDNFLNIFVLRILLAIANLTLKFLVSTS